jgi:hypothetical protein
MQLPSTDSLPETYRAWQQHASTLLEPLEALFEDGRAQLPLAGAASDHDAQADRLEAFARPALLASFWLHSLQHGASADDQARAERMADWFRRALALGVNPEHPDYWGPNANYHQNGVEMGLFVIALEVARDWLWEPLADADKEAVIRWIASNRGTGHHWNNHFYFGVFCLEFLESVGAGRWADRASIDHWFEEMELMVRGQGWFMDGMNQSYDHYNAYAFHFYGPFWSYLYGDRDPARKERWLAWNRQFLDSYQHSFAPSGEHPAFGRSITYRFNASAPFAMGQLMGSSPLPAGRSRRLCTRNLEFFLKRPIYQEQGAIGMGWTDVFPDVAEPYSCAGSVYWCAKAFSALLIPPTDDFWTAEESPLVSETEEFSHVVKSAGLVFRRVENDVEILNAGSEICAGNRDKFGPFKWGKIAYRTGFAFTLGQKDAYSPDLGLTATDLRVNRTFGRHYTVPLVVTDSYYLSSYNLGDRDQQANASVETLVAWHGPWLLQVHRFQSYQPMRFIAGGYALPVAQGESVNSTNDGHWAHAQAAAGQVTLQKLTPQAKLEIGGRFDESIARSHLAAPFHRTMTASLELPEADTGTLAVIVGASRETANTLGPWTVEAEEGRWTLRQGDAAWAVQHPWLQPLD